jgi:serine/threonine-protein kinase HipA
MRQLRVWIDRTPAGTLSEGDDLWVFEYERDWAEARESFDLAPGLPRTQLRHADGGTHRPVQWYFDNLLPEELLRQAISKEANIKGDDAFALLEYLGAESAGSLTLLPPGQELPASGALQELPDEVLSARIEKLPRTTLTADAPKRMSLAGAQHKLLVVMQGDKLFEPVGATPSTHILKPGHPDVNSYPASVANEFITMRLAAACGLPVPSVWLRYVPEPVYIVERFDRRIAIGRKGPDVAERHVMRRHIIDACQLLNRARLFKHTGASLEALQEVIARTTNKVATRLQLFRWLVFNIAVANDDSHLKNLSFFMNAEGVQLAPHYDLLATSAYYTRAFADHREAWPQVPMAIALPGAQRFGEVTARSVLDAGQALGVPNNVAARIVREVITRLPAALAKEAAALEEFHKGVPEAARRFMAAETRLVRVMQSMVIPDMLKRMASAGS